MKTRQIDRNGKHINVADVWVLQRVNFFTKEFGCSVYESEEEAKSVFDSKVKEIMKKKSCLQVRAFFQLFHHAFKSK